METVSLDLWAVNLEPVLPDLTSWLARVDERMAAATARGAHMLVMPEFACAQWFSFAPADLPTNQSLQWLSEVGTVALDAITAMSVHYGVSVLAGTIPFPAALPDGVPGFLNRA